MKINQPCGCIYDTETKSLTICKKHWNDFKANSYLHIAPAINEPKIIEWNGLKLAITDGNQD
jgi:hypothetical protein